MSVYDFFASNINYYTYGYRAEYLHDRRGEGIGSYLFHNESEDILVFYRETMLFIVL